MALDELLAALEREVRADADRLLEEARADATAWTAACEARSAEQHEIALGQHLRRTHAALESVLAEARHAARQEVLEGRDQLLERIFTAAHDACPEAITRASYLATLPDRVAAAIACHPPDAALVLSAPPALLQELERQVAGDPRITVREDPRAGSGFRCVAADGRVAVVETLESRLAARRTDLARATLRRLGVTT